MAIDQYSRVKHKRTIVSGATPTLGPSDDHTDGSWVNDDIYPGEFFLDMGGQVGWFGYSGTSSGVGVWMSGDTSVGSVTAGEYLSSEQTGANINISYTGSGYFLGGMLFDYKNLIWGNGSGDLVEEIFAPSLNQQVIHTEAFVLIKDTVNEKAYFGVFNGTGDCGFIFDGTTGNELGGAAFDTNNIYLQDGISEVNDGITNCFLYWNAPTDSIYFRIGTYGTFPPADCRVRLLFRRRSIYAP